MDKNNKTLLSSVIITLIRGYQRFISPLFRPRCRFYPTCSTYAIESITQWGAGKGLWLMIKRLLKCQPWHDGGIDMVPVKQTKR